jgi:hypothetical protein
MYDNLHPNDNGYAKMANVWMDALTDILPIADAGPDQTVNEGDTVMLDGSNSSDPDDGIASYLWTQLPGGTTVTLSDPTAAQPTFVTPPVDATTMVLTFQLTVTDNGGLQNTDEISVAINDNGITGFPDGVITFESSTGEDIGIKVDSGGNLISLVAVDPATVPDTTNRPENLIYGLIGMQVKVAAPGDTANVTIYLPNPAPDGYKWFKYGPNKGWYDYSDNATFNALRDQVTLTLTDGGDGDDDGVDNGVIFDPSGLGTTAANHRITAPTGGETIPSGTSYTICWVAPPEAVSFKLKYSKNNGRTWKPIASEIADTSYEWTVPIPPENKKRCLVKVIGYDGSDQKVGADKSDSTFTIEVVKVTWPNGGETLTSGDIPTITWTTHETKKDVARVILKYTENGGRTWNKIATLDGNTGSYDEWTVPDVPKTKNKCKVKVVLKDAKGNKVGSDTSDGYFTIEPTP